MLRKSPSRMIAPPTKSKKLANKEKEKKKIHDMSEAGCSTSSASTSSEKIPFNVIYEKKKKFAGFGPETIACISEQCLEEAASEEICVALAEDMSSKIRDILQTACINMRQGKRKYLKQEDVDAAFKRFNVDKVYGPELPFWSTFGDPNNYSFIPDHSVDLFELANSEAKFSDPGDIGVEYSWLKDTSLFNQLLVDNSLNNYCKKIMSAAVSNNKKLRDIALKDVVKNVNIGPVIQHLCNFCFLILQKNITYCTLATPALDLLEALTFNPCMNYSVEEKQMTLLIYLLLENIMNAANRGLDDAYPICRTLGRLCLCWFRGVQIVVEKIKKYLSPEEPTNRLSAPVICALSFVGNDALNILLWPHIEAMFKCMKDIKPAESIELRSAILSAASVMYRQETWDIKWENALNLEYGDSLVPMWYRNSVTKAEISNLKTKKTSDTNDDSKQSQWFNIKKSLFKTMKVHSHQQVLNRSSQLKVMFRKSKPVTSRKNIVISGFKPLPIKQKTININENMFLETPKTESTVNIISGRRTLLTLKRVYTVDKVCNKRIRDMLCMM